MSLPSICICKAEVVDDVNAVWEARGRGPNNFSRKLCAVDPLATDQTPATHYLVADSSTSYEEVQVMHGFANNQLPPLPEGVYWGVDGIISSEDAQIALNGTNLQVYSASGDVAPVDHANGILESRGLQFVPDPPL